MGGCGGVEMGRLARNKSFFQKTLEAPRGVFWRRLGSGRGGCRSGGMGALGSGGEGRREGAKGGETRGETEGWRGRGQGEAGGGHWACGLRGLLGQCTLAGRRWEVGFSGDGGVQRRGEE